MLTARDAKDARGKKLQGGNYRCTVVLLQGRQRRERLALYRFFLQIFLGVLGVLRGEGIFVAGLYFKERA